MDKFLNFFQSLWSFLLYSFPWRQIFYFIKDLFLILNAIILAIIVFVFFKIKNFRPKFSLVRKTKIKPLSKNILLKKQWQEIKKIGESEEPEKIYAAIIEADKLIENILKEEGIEGEHLADRLKKLDSYEIKTLNRLWEAHRFRNNLAHQEAFQPTLSEAKKALKDYEAFLKEIKVI